LKALLISLIFFVNSALATDHAQTLNSISELRWDNRIILINGNESDLKQLSDNQRGIAERHIVWFLFTNNTIYSNSNDTLSKSLHSQLKEKHFNQNINTVLIGKDGGVKSKNATLDLVQLWSLIDNMPMRIQEIQYKSKGSL